MAIRVGGLPEASAHRAIDAAFEEIRQIHVRMSFHEADSDVSRLNREAFHRPVAVDPRTAQVLELSRQMGDRSDGCFDITVAGRLVEWGLLPVPERASRPDPAASWRDIGLRPDGTVRFRRRLWIDLGGIAKGYAVDRAVECLRRLGVVRCCVNAGGDLRTWGPRMERIHLAWPPAAEGALPILELENGSVASSRGHRGGPHVHGRRRGPVGADCFVSVVAERCAVADALTKIVLAQGIRSEPMIRTLGARAYLHRPRDGWRALGTP